MYFGALYSKKHTKVAVISGMDAGFCSSLLWMIFFHCKESAVFGLVNAITGEESVTLIPNSVIQFLDPLFIALTMSIIVTIIVQIASKKQLSSQLIEKSFEGVGRNKT